MAKRVVIVGGGFGGLRAAQGLGGFPDVDVTVIDRRNHFLFQPLLYQVATASLSPSDIGAPIRQVLSPYRNITVHLDTVLSVDLGRRVVLTDSDPHPYDYLILACGSSHSYFGREDWEDLAPGLKTIEQALEIRRRLLLAFERAEKEPDPAVQARLLTFVIVGGGPTGVELAGSVTELAHGIVTNEFRRLGRIAVRVVLVQGGDRILPSFAPDLSEKALAALRKKGVEVRLGQQAEDLGPAGVRLGGELLATETVMWAAGVRPSGLNAILGIPLARDGRVPVLPDLSVAGHPELFVVGDQAYFEIGDGKGRGALPGLAPVAMQQGRAAARNILRDLAGKAREPFRYVDKGTMAVIGRSFAVTEIGRLRLAGLAAWLIWVFVHIVYLVGHRNRAMVLLNWAWSYFTFKRGARLITFQAWKESEAPKPGLAPRRGDHSESPAEATPRK